MLIRHAFRIGRVQYGPGSSLGPRDTIGYEFVRNLKGQICWTCDGQAHELGPGSFILSQPGHIEYYQWDRHDLTQHDYIHFYLHDLPQDFPRPESWASTADIAAGNILHAQFQYIIDLNRSHHPQAFALIKQTLDLMLHAWVYDLHQFEGHGFKDFSKPVQRVLDLVHARWRQQEFRPPALDIMVQQSGVSRSSLIRAFRQECGDSPGRFFEHQCLLFARLLLLESDRSIETIAEELGYANPFHFSRNFKQFLGSSPRLYRQQQSDTDISDYTLRHVFELLSATQII